jgi:hypothetical protein
MVSTLATADRVMFFSLEVHSSALSYKTVSSSSEVALRFEAQGAGETFGSLQACVYTLVYFTLPLLPQLSLNSLLATTPVRDHLKIYRLS